MVRGVVIRARREWEQRYTVEKYREGITSLMAKFVPLSAHETAAPRSA
jgi:hypothetical protein